MPTRSRWFSFQVWPALGYSILIMIAGSLPAAAMGPQQLNDKLLHLIGFGGLALLSCRATRYLWPGLSERTVAFVGFMSAVVLGGALEIWQGLLSYRSAEWLDWVADSLGGALAVGLRAVAAPALRALKAPPT